MLKKRTFVQGVVGNLQLRLKLKKNRAFADENEMIKVKLEIK